MMTPFEKDKEAFGEESSGLLDLRFGCPSFMRPYWKTRNTDIAVLSGNDMPYTSAMKNGKLEDAIRDIHAKVGNAETNNYHIVVGHGASQVISAALYALSLKGIKFVHAAAPYFPRFEHFTSFAGNSLKFNNRLPDILPQEYVQIVTNPNNPCGSNLPTNPNVQYKVYDLCYMWPQYTGVKKYAEDIMVFSLAKATGHASTRVGWALVKDKELADDMTHYVEMSTSGVSFEAKYHAERILTSQSVDFNGTCFKYGADKLKRRWETFHKVVENNKEIKLLNNNGMFIWGKTLDEKTDSTDYLKSEGILGVNGQYFGMSDKNHFRLNIGCELERFEKLIEICGKISLK